MFGIGLPELILIMVIALIVIGPNKLPDLAKALGRGMAEFRKATQDIKESLDLDGEIQEVKRDFNASMDNINDPMGSEALDWGEEGKTRDETDGDNSESHEKNKEENSVAMNSESEESKTGEIKRDER
ncbi:MAG: twin-arginine translocase TatA/TatE family subunit [Pseudomonadota bacterium]